MRFESKHSYYKRVYAANHNHVNILYSVANRHQNMTIYHLLSNEYFSDIQFGSQHALDYDLVQFIRLSTQVKHESSFLKWIIKRGVRYEIGDVIITGRYHNLPLFAQIKTVIAQNQTIHF